MCERLLGKILPVGEKLSRRGKKAVAKEAGEVVSREEGKAIYRATLESLLASTGWTPRAADTGVKTIRICRVRPPDGPVPAMAHGPPSPGWPPASLLTPKSSYSTIK